MQKSSYNYAYAGAAKDWSPPNGFFTPPSDPEHDKEVGGYWHVENGGEDALNQPYTSHCTDCHGPNLYGGLGPSCYQCHRDVWDEETGTATPPLDHNVLIGSPDAWHAPGYGTPNEPYVAQPARYGKACTACHGPNLDDGFAPSCLECHGPLWEQANQPPDVNSGGPYSGVAGRAVEFDASATTDPDEDPLWYEWDFEEGVPPTAPSPDPTATYTYAAAGTYVAVLTVDDEVNDPVSVDVTVEIFDDGPPPQPADSWVVATKFDPAEEFTITFENYDGALMAVKDDGSNPPSFAFGVEYSGVIFWVEVWIDVSRGGLWGIGNTYFGCINRAAGTMWGIVLDDAGGIATFRGEPENP